MLALHSRRKREVGAARVPQMVNMFTHHDRTRNYKTWVKCVCIWYLVTMSMHAGMAVRDSDGFGRGSDSGGVGIVLRYLTVICMGISTLQERVPDSDGFGR
jgi:hypothetical protein